jgi:hypothetical protein
MNNIFKSLAGGRKIVSRETKPKKKKYTMIGCEVTGEVKESFSTDSQYEAYEKAKTYPVANVISRRKTVVFEKGKITSVFTKTKSK